MIERRRVPLWGTLAGLCLCARALAAPAAEIDWRQVEGEATKLLSESIRIDTSNPPGNEVKAARFWADWFGAVGLETHVFEPEPGRASVLARLPGQGGARPIILLNHLDVVPADAALWTHPPFDGVIEDGYVYGRGAIDCKGMAVVEAMAMLALQRAGITLSRDVLFLGTAGEETGGRLGAGWVVEHRWAELGNPQFVLNEGGAIRARPDGTRVFEVAVVEKTPLWLRLTARGESGHGSTPRGESAVTRLVRALERIRTFEPEVHVVSEVQRYYRALAETYEKGPTRDRLRDLRASLEDPVERAIFLAEPRDAAEVRNTISITVLRGSNETNVVPPSASAELDCRLLPGQEPAAFLDRLRALIDDDVDLEVLLNFPPSSSPIDSALYRAIERVAKSEKMPVVPSVLRGFTDSHFFREQGVVSYGFLPVVFGEEDERTVHGIDERISVENLREGTRRLVEILMELE